MHKRFLVQFIVMTMIVLMWGCSSEQITDLPDSGHEFLSVTPVSANPGAMTLDDLKSNPVGSVVTGGVDLAVTQFSVTPEVVSPGDELVISAMVENLGSATANGPFDVWIGVLATNFEFGRVTLSMLEPGAGRSRIIHFTVPVAKLAKSYPSGIYTLYCTHNLVDNNPTNNYLLADVELPSVINPSGDIQVEVYPTGLDAFWTLTHSDGSSQPGRGSMMISGADTGAYTINWGDVSGYLTPPVETKTLLDGQVLLFKGYYQSNSISDYMTMYFDVGGGPDVPGEFCTTAAFLDHVTAYIVYKNPSLPETRGFECGFDITSLTKDVQINTSVSVSYPAPATDVGVIDGAAGTYNYIATYAQPRDIPAGGNGFILATLDIFVLDAGELDFTLRPSSPSSDPMGELPMILLNDFSLMAVQLGMLPGSPTMILNPAGECTVQPIE